MEFLQLASLLSCKACPILPKLGPSLGFRPLRQAGFGSLWRNRTQYGCLMTRSFNSVDGGSSNQEWSYDVENEEEEERGLPPYEIGKSEVSKSKLENVADNQLKEIKVELRKNNEEIKRLQETVQKSWERVRTEVEKSFRVHTASIIQKAAQDLLEIKRKEAAQQLKTTPENETQKDTYDEVGKGNTEHQRTSFGNPCKRRRH